MKGDKLFRDCDRHIVETVTPIKYVTEYEQMWTRMDEFLSKFQGSGIKIHRANLIQVAKTFIYFNILRAIVR